MNFVLQLLLPMILSAIAGKYGGKAGSALAGMLPTGPAGAAGKAIGMAGKALPWVGETLGFAGGFAAPTLMDSLYKNMTEGVQAPTMADDIDAMQNMPSQEMDLTQMLGAAGIDPSILAQVMQQRQGGGMY